MIWETFRRNVSTCDHGRRSTGTSLRDAVKFLHASLKIFLSQTSSPSSLFHPLSLHSLHRPRRKNNGRGNQKRLCSCRFDMDGIARSIDRGGVGLRARYFQSSSSSRLDAENRLGDVGRVVPFGDRQYDRADH